MNKNTESEWVKGYISRLFFRLIASTTLLLRRMKSFGKIAILGTGNVAWHLCKALLAANLSISGIYGRNKKSLKAFKSDFDIPVFTDFKEINTADVAICAISDNALVNYLEELQLTIPVAYTSGSIPLESFSINQIGVFYPLQTFTKGTDLSLDNVPFLIESKDETLAKKLYNLAAKISKSVHYADSKTRSELHLAAVFANNFTNHMFTIAETYLKQQKINFNFLLPLIEESVKKLNLNAAKAIQTGPAKRGDQNIIQAHLDKLGGREKEIYALLTKAIQEKHEKL